MRKTFQLGSWPTKLWQGHFGRGLARSSGDFGRLGERPTHPELLEHLAQRVLDRKWSLKAMHREIMLSRAYRMSSRASDNAFNRPKQQPPSTSRSSSSHGRAISRCCFASVRPDQPEDVRPFGLSRNRTRSLATASRPNEAWGRSSSKTPTGGPSTSSPSDLCVSHCLKASTSSPDSACLVRFDTNVPTQSLLTLNGNFVNDAALHFSDRLQQEASGLPQQIERGLRLAFGRAPSSGEVDRHVDFVQRISEDFALSEASALLYFALSLLNANEFMWID